MSSIIFKGCGVVLSYIEADICIQNAQTLRSNKEFHLMMKKILSVGIMIAFIFITPTPAFAVGSGGFENASFSAKQLGLGGTGTATPDEPAAISYNPAGIADLPGVQVQGDANFISLMTFKHNDVTGDTRSAGTLNLIPTGYITINPGKIFQSTLISPIPGAAPSQAVVTWETFEYIDTDPADGRFVRAYGGTWADLVSTCSVSFNGGVSFYGVTDGGVVNIPLLSQGTDFIIRITNTTSHVIHLGSWAVVY